MRRAGALAGIKVILGDSQHIVLALRVLLAGSGLLGDDLEPPLDRGEVGKHQVESELLQLGGGIRIWAKATSDLDQHVRLASEGDALGAAPGGSVLDTHLGGSHLEGLHRRRQAIEALVGHVHHADAVGSTSRGQRVEERGLARPGGADDRDVDWQG